MKRMRRRTTIAKALHHLPLRWQLAVWTGLLVTAACVFLVTSINLLTLVVPSGRLPVLSLIGLVLAVLVSGGGIYWVARFALRPVAAISDAVAQIDRTSLHTRLPLDGPDDELRHLAQSFNAMLDRLDHAFAQQARFVADAAHELRTPLATLRTQVEVTCADPDATLHDYQHMAAACERAITRLEHLMTDLLVLTTEEQIHQPTPVALSSLVAVSIAELAPIAHAHHITVRFEGEEATVWGNASLLAIAVRNLLDNGIRYNHREGEVLVNIVQNTRDIMLTVTDTGIGLVPADQAQIFERFYRVDLSRSRHQGGAGLGLAIVQHIMVAHHGAVTVQSQHGQGSTFTLVLPKLG